MGLEYAVQLIPDDNGTLLVACPDLPEVTTFGSDEADALSHARDAIEEAIAARIAGRGDIPALSGQRGRRRSKAAAEHSASRVARVILPTQTALKAMLYGAMRAQNLRKADLERRLGMHGPQIDRLLNPPPLAPRPDRGGAAFSTSTTSRSPTEASVAKREMRL